MILEELCVVRELAERMAKLGWPQEESLFVWGKNTKLTINKDKWFLSEHRNHCLIWFAAPTAPEILKKLGEEVHTRMDKNIYIVETYSYPNCHKEVDKTSLANAAAEYWCWWKEKEK